MEHQITEVPSFGLIAYERNVPIAAGFLRKVEGGYAMLDSYITDPNQPNQLRDKALDRITKKLIKIAQMEGIRKLLVFTADPNTYIRSINLNFTELPHRFSVLSLSNYIY